MSHGCVSSLCLSEASFTRNLLGPLSRCARRRAYRPSSCACVLFGSVRAVTLAQYFRWLMEAPVDKFLHEKNLEMYRAQLNCTTNDTRRQILRLISEDRKRYLPKAGLTAPNFHLAAATAQAAPPPEECRARLDLTLNSAGSPCAVGRPKALPKGNYALRDGHCN